MTRLHTCIVFAFLAGCGDEDTVEQPPEVITTVNLTFTPMGGGTPITYAFDDPDGDGGNVPTIDTVSLTAGTYMLAVGLQNKLETPPEEITDEVRDEGDEHQLFFTGAAIDGPATTNPSAPLVHAYADTDGAGLPIGLSNTITVRDGASGQLTVTLKHLPPIDGNPQKTSDLAAMVKAGGITSIGGDTDVQVNFTATVP